MLSRSEIKTLRSLGIKKFRKQLGQYLIEGYRLVLECLTSGYPIESLWVSESFAVSEKGQDILEELETRNLDWDVIPDEDLSRITDTRHDQGIVALLPLSLYTREPVTDSTILILENIADPGNLGTLLRTAEWFGIQSVILSENSVDPFSPKVVRAAMGAHFYLSIYMKPLEDFLPGITERKYDIIGGVMDGTPMRESLTGLKKNRALLLGNEAHGLGEEARGYLTHRVTISGNGQGESLNLSVAGGILMYELTKTGY